LRKENSNTTPSSRFFHPHLNPKNANFNLFNYSSETDRSMILMMNQ